MTIGDKILIIIIVITILLVTTLIFTSSLQDTSANNIAVVNLRGKEHSKYLLDENKIISLSENIELEINNGRIRAVKNTCPRNICIHRGWIYRQGQTICCVPNKMLIEIVSRDMIYNGVTY